MASKFVLHTLPFIFVLVLVQTLPTFQLIVLPTGPRKEHILMFQPSETKVIVDVNEIAKAVWDAAGGRYKIMSLILQNHLSSVVPYGRNCFPGTRWCGCREYDRSIVTVYNNNTITIFVPLDESFSDVTNWKTLEYQFVTAKVDKEAFDSGYIGTGSELLTCDLHCKSGC
ncbi:hypothetical protein DITRI_Ditri10aG0173000 [Diplodiscus trichospermus]